MDLFSWVALERERYFFGFYFKQLLKYLNGLFGFCVLMEKQNLRTRFRRKEVMKMTDKKTSCGCGCVPLKIKDAKTTKDDKKIKKSK